MPADKTPEDVFGRKPKAALIVGHPPHVLTLYGWMTKFQPLVHILTDGSGGKTPFGRDTLSQTIKNCGGTPGEIFAEMSEMEFYGALLRGDQEFFIAIADRLAASLVQHNIDLVAADAQEGDNTVHDLCRALADAAVELAMRKTGRRIANFACYQTEWAQPGRQLHDETCVHYALDGRTFAEKCEAMSMFSEWHGAIQEAIDGLGLDSFRTECLRPVLDHSLPRYFVKPYYETFAENRVAAGKYTTVIRYDDHVRPIWNALRAYVGRPS